MMKTASDNEVNLFGESEEELSKKLLQVLEELAEEDRQLALSRACPTGDGREAHRISASAQRLLGATKAFAPQVGTARGEIKTADEDLRRLLSDNMRRSPAAAASGKRPTLSAPRPIKA